MCMFKHISAYFHCISFAYLTNTVYIFAYFKHIFTYNCIFFAYLCIYISIPASRVVGCSYNRVVCSLHCSQAHADSPSFGDPGAPPWLVPRPGRPAAGHTPATQQPPPPPTRRRRISLAPAAGQSDIC